MTLSSSLRQTFSFSLFVAVSLCCLFCVNLSAQEAPTDEQIATWKTEADKHAQLAVPRDLLTLVIDALTLDEALGLLGIAHHVEHVVADIRLAKTTV